jgi:hypothetical protein
MYNSTHSLTSALDGVSRPGRFTARERAPGTHWIGGWVGPRAGLNAVVKRKIPSPQQKSNPRTPIVQARSPVLYRLSYHALFMFGMRWKMLQRRILCFSDLLTKRLPTALEVFNIINHFLEEKNKLRDVNWTQLCRISGTGKKQSL